MALKSTWVCTLVVRCNRQKESDSIRQKMLKFLEENSGPGGGTIVVQEDSEYYPDDEEEM